MMIEGSGSGAGSESGSIPLTNGSGSGRPKNMWIRWIRIRIRIRNTGSSTSNYKSGGVINLLTDVGREWDCRNVYCVPIDLKVPKCEIFDPFFFTPVNPIWVGDFRTGEKKFFFRRLRQIFAIFFFYAGFFALKICLRRLTLR
jgi:hypothetical protein